MKLSDYSFTLIQLCVETPNRGEERKQGADVIYL